MGHFLLKQGSKSQEEWTGLKTSTGHTAWNSFSPNPSPPTFSFLALASIFNFLWVMSSHLPPFWVTECLIVVATFSPYPLYSRSVSGLEGEYLEVDCLPFPRFFCNPTATVRIWSQLNSSRNILLLSNRTPTTLALLVGTNKHPPKSLTERRYFK